MTITDYEHKLWNYTKDRQGLFRLTYGIYHPERPYISRESKGYLFEAENEAKQFLRDQQKIHGEMGYRTWVAILDKPDGSKEWFS